MIPVQGNVFDLIFLAILLLGVLLVGLAFSARLLRRSAVILDKDPGLRR